MSDYCIICLDDINKNDIIDSTGYCNCKIKYHKKCLNIMQTKYNLLCVVCRKIKHNHIDIDHYIDNILIFNNIDYFVEYIKIIFLLCVLLLLLYIIIFDFLWNGDINNNRIKLMTRICKFFRHVR